MESLTGGTRWSGDPTCHRDETGPAALLYRRGQNSTAASSPVVTSSPDFLPDLAHLMSHLASLIIDSRDDGSGNGGAARLDYSGTPVMTSVAQPNVQTSIYERWRT